MPRHTNLMSLFEDIATQIRAKKGESSSVTYKVDDLDTAVSTITTYKPEETFSVTPTTSQQIITPSSGHVFSSGIVNGADIINHVSSVPVSKSTDIIYNSNDNNYYIWED